jgi:hypothetical protein
MPTKKLFLVQFLIEADVSEWPDFDEVNATDYFLSALKLSPEDRKLSAQVYLLARKPNERGDVLVEKYEDRGLMVEIYQNANTVGADIPTYFVMIFNPKAQSPSSVAGDEHLTVESAKEEARARVDRRLERERKRRQRGGTEQSG